ncbi:MAG: methionyl-tRNA formyltransferase [Actinomycetota bacterium]
MRIGVAATAPLGADVLERLNEMHDVAFLLTRPDRPQGRGRRVGAPPAKQVAERLGIEVRQPEKLDESTNIDGVEAIVVAAYGALIPEVLLERTLWLNVHPSLLPRWRGAAPVERAIMAGDTESGVTIHRTTAELDAGPIAAQQAFSIEGEDAGGVYAKAGELAAELLAGVLAAPEFHPQPEEGATYADRLTAADRELDWDRPADELLNRIRALSPHIGARGVVDGRTLTVWRAAPAGSDARLTAGGLELLEVQPESKRRMTGEEYLRGLRD